MRTKYLLFITLFFISCSEIINFTYEDSKKSEIDFFFEDRDTFKFHHDIDNSKIDGYFITDNLENYSLKVEKSASNHKWDKIVNDKDKKMYIKKEESNYSICIIHFIGKEVHLSIYSF